MKQINYYQLIKNPLDDEETFDEMIKVYGENSAYYNGLIKVFSKDKDMRYSIAESDRLHSGLFNNWKKQLLSITPKQYEQAIKNGLYDQSIYKLLELLRKTPDVKTKKEADDILFAEYDDEELQSAMDKYSWSGDQMSWTHIRKRKITGKKVSGFPIEHRLYINVDTKYLHEMSRYFIEKCEEKGMNFYFKIAEFDRRDDSMVIYSDSENLYKYADILEEIRMEHPEMNKAFREPTLLSGRINGWIGYGSEPLSEHTSYNSLRSKIIETSIKETMNEWYKQNQTRSFKYKGKILTFSEYVAKRLVEEQIKKAKEIYDRKPDAKFADFTKEELEDEQYLAAHLKKVTAEIEPLIASILTKTSTDKKIIYKSGDKERRITTYDISSILRKIAPEIIKSQPYLKQQIKDRIIAESIKKGIDPNNFCFDVKNRDLLLKVPQEETKKQEPSPKKKPEQKQPQGYVYKPMTDEEIEESRRKIGEYVPPKKKPEQKQPQEYVYKPMTDEEIEQSRRHIGEYVPPKTRPLEEILKSVKKQQETKTTKKTSPTTSPLSARDVKVNQTNATINQNGIINQNGGINIVNVGTININVPPVYAYEQGQPRVINPQKKKSNQKVKTK